MTLSVVSLIRRAIVPSPPCSQTCAHTSPSHTRHATPPSRPACARTRFFFKRPATDRIIDRIEHDINNHSTLFTSLVVASVELLVNYIDIIINWIDFVKHKIDFPVDKIDFQLYALGDRR